MRNECVEFAVFAERVYKAFLDLIKHELDNVKANDINSVQAFILLNIDDNLVTMSEIISKGYYIGSNASYNLRKMLDNGYLEQKSSNYDKRIAYLNVTKKGSNLLNKLKNQLDKHAKKLGSSFNFRNTSGLLSDIEEYWKSIFNRIR